MLRNLQLRSFDTHGVTLSRRIYFFRCLNRTSVGRLELTPSWFCQGGLTRLDHPQDLLSGHSPYFFRSETFESGCWFELAHVHFFSAETFESGWSGHAHRSHHHVM